MSKWVKATKLPEKLPGEDHSADVLLMMEDSKGEPYMMVAYVFFPNFDIAGERPHWIISGPERDRPYGNVTHWHPLPERYPPYPESDWDWEVKTTASQALEPPNKVICIYCHDQAVTQDKLTHEADCPAKE